MLFPHQNQWRIIRLTKIGEGKLAILWWGIKYFFQWSCWCTKVHWIQCKRKGAPKSGGKCHWIQWKKMWFTENGDKACTEFGDEKGNSPNSVMNSSLAGKVHIYAAWSQNIRFLRLPLDDNKQMWKIWPIFSIEFWFLMPNTHFSS